MRKKNGGIDPDGRCPLACFGEKDSKKGGRKEGNPSITGRKRGTRRCLKKKHKSVDQELLQQTHNYHLGRSSNIAKE